MKLFAVDFNGHYPVGTAAVVVAQDIDQAFALAIGMLVADGLWDEVSLICSSNNSKNFTHENLTEISLKKAGAHMLNNGNY